MPRLLGERGLHRSFCEGEGYLAALALDELGAVYQASAPTTVEAKKIYSRGLKRHPLGAELQSGDGRIIAETLCSEICDVSSTLGFSESRASGASCGAPPP